MARFGGDAKAAGRPAGAFLGGKAPRRARGYMKAGLPRVRPFFYPRETPRGRGVYYYYPPPKI